jgi:ATP-dependent Clp protease ATP-binding subunit ClpX
MSETSGGGGKESSYSCSFCSKSQTEVKRLIAGSEEVYICDECVAVCTQIISGANLTGLTTDDFDGISIEDFPKPKSIYDRLQEYVIGQEHAKRVLSVGVYNHYKKMQSQHINNADSIELGKTNILLVGPTGSGKTLLAETLSRILEVPFAIVDATSLTEAGYVGEDVENILLKLIQAAGNDIKKAQKGIIYVDEIDKTARRTSNPSITRDVSGEGVQQALLKIIEGAVVNVPPQGGRKHPQQEFIQIDTSGILFICGGAFEAIDEIIEKRVSKNRHVVGFNLSNGNDDDDTDSNTMSNLSHDDLLEYGMIPEFVGRMPLAVALNPLKKEDLLRVLKEPRNSLVKQYLSLFEMDGVKLSFTEGALDFVVEQALKQNTGARALRTIMEDILLDLMYEIPSIENVHSCVISKDVAEKRVLPTLLDENGNKIDWETIRKTA